MLTLFLHGDWLTIVIALAYWALRFGIPIFALVIVIRWFVRRKKSGE